MCYGNGAFLRSCSGPRVVPGAWVLSDCSLMLRQAGSIAENEVPGPARVLADPIEKARAAPERSGFVV